MIDLLFWQLVKLIAYFMGCLLIYLLYKVIYVPIKFRRFYGKYKNVFVSSKFIPVLGDIYYYLQDIQSNRVFYDHNKRQQQSFKPNEIDLRADLLGTDPMIGVVSHKALKEVISQIPGKIDRADIDNTPCLRRAILKMCEGCFVNSPSTKKTIERRKSLTKILGLNHSSKNIPLMLKNADIILQDMKTKGEAKMQDQMALLTNRILVSFLFGRDYEEHMSESYEYLYKDGTTKKFDLCSFFANLAVDMSDESGNLFTILFPLLNVSNIINPWKRNHLNKLTLYEALRKIVKKSQDEDSFWNQVRKLNEFTEDEILVDLMILLTAGSETTADNFVALLYYLKKFPEAKEKLMKELAQVGIVPGCDFNKAITMENIQACDYLSNAVKESLRMDSPLNFTVFYQAYKDTEICGVSIPKGTILKQEIAGPNNDDKDWLDPDTFEPDRHNTESEFFKKSKEQGKIQNVFSRRTFGHGPRMCPGMSFATLEMKVFAAFFLTQMDYEVSKEDLENDHIGFGIGSQFSPKFKIT
ncbi:unnamed protein product [Moneuplotes crassus]|uniref:Cytochrome P450 n=1 Tax=Euplotes crassus TaxID=5936 RepID=A0AAD1Y8T8_EUPCR|nr:unnamed protein product [Moneuplotes crassus]